jgi:hypothetical protein
MQRLAKSEVVLSGSRRAALFRPSCGGINDEEQEIAHGIETLPSGFCFDLYIFVRIVTTSQAVKVSEVP